MTQEQTTEQVTSERDEAEAVARLQEEINNLPVSEHLVFMLQSLSSLAVDRLGLAPEATTRKDPAQARLAIDAMRALLGVLEQERPAAEIATYRGMLSQLQFAYVGALGSGPAAAQDAQPAPEAAAQVAPAAPEPKAAAAEAADEPAPIAAPKKSAKPRAGSGGAAAKPGARGAKGDTKTS